MYHDIISTHLMVVVCRTYQFHPLVTLALVVADGDIEFRLAIRDTDHCCGFVNTTLKLTLVATFVWIGVLWIFPAVA